MQPPHLMCPKMWVAWDMGCPTCLPLLPPCWHQVIAPLAGFLEGHSLAELRGFGKGKHQLHKFGLEDVPILQICVIRTL